MTNSNPNNIRGSRPSEDKHWLERPATIAKFWKGGGICLLLLIVCEFFYHPHPYFNVDGWFAFNAVFGFIACVIMVLLAKILGIYVKRDQDYYDRD